MSDYRIEQLEELPTDVENLVDEGHIKDEAECGIVCNYKKYALVLKDKNGDVLGVLQAYTAFSEVYVDDIWVKPSHRNQNLGRKLLEDLEARFKGKGFNNINLVTSDFSAPEFYKKCGYKVEFVRINKKNPLLSKTFFIKYFDDEDQHQGIMGHSLVHRKVGNSKEGNN